MGVVINVYVKGRVAEGKFNGTNTLVYSEKVPAVKADKVYARIQRQYSQARYFITRSDKKDAKLR